jgi:subtilisin
VRKWFAVWTALLLVASLSTTVAAVPKESAESRILLRSDDANRAGLAPRRAVGHGKVTADLTETQRQALQRRGIAYEVVPVRSIDATENAKAKPNKPGGSRPTPASQVPYGVKMIYGNPNLTAADVTGGQGITVAVLDTGSVNHPDFTRADGSGVITGCADFSQKRSPLVEGSCADGHGHGTHVTGTVAAAGGRDGLGIFGVAPGASVLSYKVLNNQGRGYADDVAYAIEVAADRGADIISMSLGSATPSPLELDAIRYANSKGVLVIAAAGNSGPDANTIGFPGGFAEVVAVAALNPDEVVSYFSSRGITDGNNSVISDREVEVSGPGRTVLSTSKSGAYTTMSGTSMATPHVAGLAAKMWQGSASRTRDWLRSSAQAHDITRAEQINNAGSGYDVAAGYGLPQVQSRAESQWHD